MMKMRLLAILLPLMVAAGLVATLPEVAHGAPDAPHMHDNCVTYPEFVHAPYGPKRSVERYVGAKGDPDQQHLYDYNPRLKAFEYRTCDRDDWLVVLYRRKTTQAIQFWYWHGDSKVGAKRVLA